MKLIEQKLHEIHSEARRRKSESGTESEGAPRVTLPPTFARVSMVAEGSPSALAVRDIVCGEPLSASLTAPVQGLRVGDSIAEFGSVTAANFTGLKSVGGVVQHSVGVSGTRAYNTYPHHCPLPVLPASSAANGSQKK